MATKITATTPVTLVGDFVRLEPLAKEHSVELAEAVQDGELWRLWYTKIPSPEQMESEVERRLALSAEGRMLPFTWRRISDGKALGMTTYLNIDSALPRVEIGSTWLRHSAQGTAANPEAKLLMLEHAFETLECVAVEFRTSWHNRQSRAAITALGAQCDGVLRQEDRMSNGTLRDTVVFSIVPSEWPAVKAGLAHRLIKYKDSST